MAVGALLGVETIRRHAEHVVALDADAVNHAAPAGQCSVFGGVRRRRRMFSHAGILTQSGRLRARRENSQYTFDNLYYLNGP
jgi:hypothetical protein